MIPGVTGELFPEMTVESLMAVMRDFDARRYDPGVIRAHAEKFDTALFKAQINDFIDFVVNKI